MIDNNLLNDRIGRLKEWEQTGSLNEILYNALSALNEYTKDRFDALTQEIRDERAVNNGPPAIKTAVCTEENIEKQLFFFPVSTQPPLNSPGYVTTVFAECDYRTIQEFMGKTFRAQIFGKKGARRTQVTLRYSLKYLQKLESLYYAFSDNELTWATVNAIYFYKFLDVFCEKDIEETVGEIEGFEIDFLQYKNNISYDKILLWNIIPLTAPVAACETRPAYNMIQYEHSIKGLQFDDHHYLICPIGEKFISFRRGQLMYVRTYASKFEQLDLLRVTGNEEADNPYYLPLKSNRKQAGFIDNLARGRYIPTRGEAERIVHSLIEEKYLQLQDIKTLPYTEKNIQLYKGLDFNPFIETNALLQGQRKLLLFSFKVSGDKLWAYEKMSYALSELQQYFYEYRCLGELL